MAGATVGRRAEVPAPTPPKETLAGKEVERESGTILFFFANCQREEDLEEEERIEEGEEEDRGIEGL